MRSRQARQGFSVTAGYTCFSRACAQCEEGQLHGPDDLARIFLPAFARGILRVPALRRFFVSRIAPPGIYEYVLARTKLLDEHFVRALENGVPQIVVLGAGMDTRALRFAGRNRGVAVFELDLPATQGPKREILARKGVPLPEGLVFVSIDFNRENLSDVLSSAGFRADRTSLFLWEGVTMYLEEAAIDATLGFLRDTAAGTRVVFDYVYGSVLRGERRYYGEAAIHRRVAKAGEGWTFGIEEGEIERFLSDRGFCLDEHHAPADLEREYLTADDGRVVGRINGTHAIAVASVDRTTHASPTV